MRWRALAEFTAPSQTALLAHLAQWAGQVPAHLHRQIGQAWHAPAHIRLQVWGEGAEPHGSWGFFCVERVTATGRCLDIYLFQEAPNQA